MPFDAEAFREQAAEGRARRALELEGRRRFAAVWQDPGRKRYLRITGDYFAFG
jgi:hypothetical protein